MAFLISNRVMHFILQQTDFFTPILLPALLSGSKILSVGEEIPR